MNIHHKNAVLALLQDLENWRGKLDTQVKSYREVSLSCLLVIISKIVFSTLLPRNRDKEREQYPAYETHVVLSNSNRLVHMPFSSYNICLLHVIS